MRNVILSAFFLLMIFQVALGQNKLIDIRDVDTRDFPDVKGTLWVRDPEGIKASALSFLEENSDRQLNVELGKLETQQVKEKNKCVVFLVLNPGPTNIYELDWYKLVIKNALSKNIINPGDKFAVLNFNHEVGGQLLFPEEKLKFTDNANILIDNLNKIQPRYVNGLCAPSDASLIYPAINRALKLMENENVQLPSAVVVLSDDRACSSVPSNENPSDRSKRLNIPIYGISYKKYASLNKIDQLCAETFGSYFSDPNHYDPSTTSEVLVNYMRFFFKRHAGVLYPFSYKSEFEKDGKSHSVKVISPLASTAFLLPVPHKNPIEWAKDNPLLAVAVFLLLVVLVTILLLYLQKNKRKLEAEKISQQMELLNLEKSHQEQERLLSERIAAGQNEINSIKQRESQRQEAEEKKKRDLINKERELQLIELMRSRGNFPWFDYSDGRTSFRFEIRKPELTVGRSPESDLSINNQTLSRKHFQLIFTGSDYMVKDLGSSNGLYVNGTKVSQAKLKHGDFVQAGEVVLNFRI